MKNKIKKYRIDCACDSCINYKNGYCDAVDDDIIMDEDGSCLLKHHHSIP